MTKRFGVAVFSIAAHITIGVTVIVTSLLSGETLPAPRRVLAFEFADRVVRLPQDVELPAASRRASPPRAARASPPAAELQAPAAPVVAPEGLSPETMVNAATAAARSNAGLAAVEADPGRVIEGLGAAAVPAPPAAPTPPIRLHSGIQAPRRVVDVRPHYPPLARAAGVSGVVIVEAIIDASGRVESARVLRSIPVLDEAALAAVRQWQFEPARLNDEPVPVVMTVTVNFQLPR